MEAPYGARVLGYESARPDIQALIPLSARSILEVGCSVGALGEALKARQGAQIVGVEIDEVYANQARARLDRVVTADLESFVSSGVPPEAPFDCLICADVLEHLQDPWSTLKVLASWLAPDGIAVISLPNVLYARGLLRLIWYASWPRDSQGVFDGTHLRWFSRSDSVALLEGAGLELISVAPLYWSTDWLRPVKAALYRTPLGNFIPEQYVLVGKPVVHE